MVSGQICGKMFSDMGAEVIKIEGPHHGITGGERFSRPYLLTSSQNRRFIPSIDSRLNVVGRPRRPAGLLFAVKPACWQP
jgi:hypothetical protein